MGIKKFSTIVDSLNQVQVNVTAIDPIRLDSETVADYFRNNPQVKDQISDRLGHFDLGIEGMDVEQSVDGKWRLFLDHSGLSMKVPFESESAGTRQVVRVFPSLNYALHSGSLAIMDALDNDLHVDLVDEILEWFRRNDRNPHNAQLICSLHSLSTLDNLEKDEVFIVEKDESGATRAYGVGEVQGVRRSDDLRKRYRSGALGGLPVLG